ncbi:MAG TPA: hypothetical protein VK302_10625 [Terriglobales bacterium]|nr:hypothetical protein [Terriglobales bacterium]
MKQETEGPIPIRERLSALNTKAYYLLVALSFLYVKQSGAAASSLKAALTLTAGVAVAPVQDWVESKRKLEWIRRGKVAFLWCALFFTLWWVWKVS